jgi:predicted transcriptional regulator
VLDEPTDLPEGEVIELVPLDEVLADAEDDLDTEERERLHQSIERGLTDVRAGRTVDATEVIANLRAQAARR